MLDIVTKATGAVNAQAAVEAIKTDPVQLAAATQAIESNWLQLAEAGGGGIAGARAADAVTMASNGPWWQVFRSTSMWAMLLLLPLPYAVTGSVAGLWGHDGWSSDVRAAIATAIVSLVVGGAAGFYWEAQRHVTSRLRHSRADRPSSVATWAAVSIMRHYPAVGRLWRGSAP
ncbi:MAG: hypothetical protein IPK42_10760 [Betaproteobacteria bacterium]|nr:hypothetical protein [Betaproteobacteria bacterium]